MSDVVHEITAAALHILQCTAYDNYIASTCTDTVAQNALDSVTVLSFDEWCAKQCLEHSQFAFWSHVKQFEMSILLFVRSLRESNFALYIDAMTKLMPWFFAIDRTNYARWLSVHIRDMVKLSETNPNIFAEFNKGKFTVHKTCNKFSNIAIDQAHEQLNAALKGDGGIVGLTGNDMALHRWTTAGPEVARLIEEFDQTNMLLNELVEGRHHEDHASMQKSFVNDVSNLAKTMTEWGNPFEDQSDVIVLHNRNIMTAQAGEQAIKIFEVGLSQ